MSILWAAFWFVIAVSVLVTVHEFGHFWVARRVGVKVLKFSVGFGKPLLTWRAGKDAVQYVIAPIPLGGYVQLLDEREGPVTSTELPRAFTRVHPFKRVLVLLAGPGINFLFAFGVLTALLSFRGITELAPIVGPVIHGSIAARAGLARGDRILSINGVHVKEQPALTLQLLESMAGNGDARLLVRTPQGALQPVDLKVSNASERLRLTAPSGLFAGLGFSFEGPLHPAVLAKVSARGAAARAGLRAGDQILALDGKPVADFESLAARVRASPGRQVTLLFDRHGAHCTVKLRLGSVKRDGTPVGVLGVQSVQESEYPPGMLRWVRPGLVSAMQMAARQVWQLTTVQTDLLWRMMFGAVSTRNLSGPVAIASYAGQSASEGAAPFLAFLAAMSLSIGLLNLLPVPVLDGGQALFQVIEWVKGSPLSERQQSYIHTVGVALLCGLMGLAVYNDVLGLIHAIW